MARKDKEKLNGLPDFQDDVRIDPHALDKMWIEHASKYMFYADLASKADREVKELDHSKKVLEAQLTQAVNADPNETLGEGVKPTGANVDAYIRTEQSHITLTEKLIQAEYEKNQLTNALAAFNQRRSALENLVKLIALEYYAEPKHSEDTSEIVTGMQENRVGKRVSKALNKKTRRKGK